jgi:transketolase
MNDTNSLKNIRKKIIESVYYAKKGHLGGSLSSVEIIYYLFKNKIVDLCKKTGKSKNTFILSKGHASLALVAVLSFLKKNKNDILKFNKDNSLVGNNCSELVTGFEFHTGSLGHGVGLGSGVAMAKAISNKKGNTIVLISDGELHEGSVNEGILFADQLKLNLTIIIDNNEQICEGFTNKINNTTKYLNFLKNEFNSLVINGNNLSQLKKINKFIKKKGLKIIIANTIKGKGISFMEKEIRWHHSVPNDMEYNLAIKELI